MEFFNDVCILCLIHSNNIKSIESKDEDNIIIEQKLQFVVSEQTNFKLEVPKNICTDCKTQLNNLYKFKQNCIKNLTFLRKYVDEISTQIQIKKEPPDENESEEQLPFQEVHIKEEHEDDKEESSANSDPLSHEDTLEDVTKDKCNEVELSLTTHEDKCNEGELTSTTHEDKCNENEVELASTPDDGKFYKCDVCHKKFIRRSSLANHSKLHNRKPFQCEHCNKTFSTNFRLKIHKRYHIGERPFKCDVCDKGFVSRESLKVHKATHSIDKPHKCKFCPYSFTQREKLRSHLRTHTGERPFHCDFCEYRCALKSSLQSHERRKHPNKCLYVVKLD